MGLEHATLTNVDTGDRFEVLFNPTEYSLSKDNNFAEAAIPGLSLEGHRHGGRQVNQPASDVRKLTGPVVDLMAINPETHAPPVVLFAWGQLTFTGVLARATQRFTMFLDSGVPVRAQLQVSFSEWISGIEEAKAVKRRTADYTRVHVVGEGETASDIAYRAYGDPAKWRPIAIANALEDPRRPPTGAELSVPALPYRDPDTGLVHA